MRYFYSFALKNYAEYSKKTTGAKDDKTSKEYYYLGHMQAEIDKTKQFVMPNTQKTAVEILWQLDTPVREDIYRYIVEE